MDRPRILLLTREQGLAEGVLRGLRILSDPGAEVDVALAEEAAREQFGSRRYHLLISGLKEYHEASEEFREEIDGSLPIILVGGDPTGNGRTGNGVRRVPLPLSFNMLVMAVTDALGGPSSVGPAGYGCLRDFVGS